MLISNASVQADQRQLLQQKANENELLVEQQIKLMKQLEIASEMLEQKMRSAQTALSTSVIARSSDPFENLLSGRSGAGGTYDRFRRMKSWITGRKFRAAHGDKFQ